MDEQIMSELDDTDRGIIRILQKDAKRTFTEIGKELGVSDATIHIRVKKLMDAGIIKKFTIDIDRSKVDKSFVAYVLLNIQPGKMTEMINQLIKLEEIDSARAQ